MSKISYLTIILFTSSVYGDVRLPNIISDGMVLQRGIAAPVWGKAAPGEKVTVAFAGQVKTAITGDNKRWMVKLDPLKASADSRSLTIKGKNEIVIKDVLVGEVWLASGDGGMEFNLTELAEDEKGVVYAE